MVATAHSLTYYLASSILVNLGGLPRPYPRPGMHSRYKSVGPSASPRAHLTSWPDKGTMPLGRNLN
jgi:hypothetical protein